MNHRFENFTACGIMKSVPSCPSIRLFLQKQDNQSGPVYIMGVQGDYYFDDFLEQGGAENDSQLIDFVVGNITKEIIPVPVIYDARQLEQVYHIVKGEVK